MFFSSLGRSGARFPDVTATTRALPKKPTSATKPATYAATSFQFRRHRTENINDCRSKVGAVVAGEHAHLLSTGALLQRGQQHRGARVGFQLHAVQQLDE